MCFLQQNPASTFPCIGASPLRSRLLLLPGSWWWWRRTDSIAELRVKTWVRRVVLGLVRRPVRSSRGWRRRWSRRWPPSCPRCRRCAPPRRSRSKCWKWQRVSGRLLAGWKGEVPRCPPAFMTRASGASSRLYRLVRSAASRHACSVSRGEVSPLPGADARPEKFVLTKLKWKTHGNERISVRHRVLCHRSNGRARTANG